MSDWPETNHSLIRRVKDLRDQHAWSELMALYRPVVHRLARRNGLDHENAEDVFQNVFVSVSTHIQNWEEKPDGPRFRNWLGRVARNAALNALTRGTPDRATGASSALLRLHSTPLQSDASSTMCREVQLEAIRHAASLIRHEFSDLTWSVFSACAIDGKEAAEVAASHGCSIGTVYVYRCRVTARLRDKVKEFSDWWEDGK